MFIAFYLIQLKVYGKIYVTCPSVAFIMQIADFGMSRDLDDLNYYITSGGKIPVKWTAPEVCYFMIKLWNYNLHVYSQALLYKKYSTFSDVWSFGCVLFEMWSLGHKPFEETPVREVQNYFSCCVTYIIFICYTEYFVTIITYLICRSSR